MGTETAQTVREIEEARDRLSNNIRELEDRLPSPARLAKRAGAIAVGSGMSGGVTWFFIRRLRKRRGRTKATEAIVEPRQMIVQVIPERWSEALTDARTRSWAAGLASAFVLLRLAELRRLRALNKSLTAGRM